MITKHSNDTIVAIATAPGMGAIGVIRLSGTNLAEFAYHLCKQNPVPRQALLTTWLNADGVAIDQGITIYFPCPHSFTGEDVLELQGHGGIVVLSVLLRRCLELGARLAKPGEFTQRAFLNDKLDLVQAEAVADLIEASSEQAAHSALHSLQGEFSKKIAIFSAKLIELRMTIERILDFPEEDSIIFDRYKSSVVELYSELDNIFICAKQGNVLRTGLSVALVGQPNVGKSLLLNRLIGKDRAIVTAIPGTTRDTICETLFLEGIPFHIIDTAGIRITQDPIEEIGIQRAFHEIEQADIIVNIFDLSESNQNTNFLRSNRTHNISYILIENKSDLVKIMPERIDLGNNLVRIILSAKTGDGVELLKNELLRIAGWQAREENIFLARERHLNALNSALRHLNNAISDNYPIELLAEELKLAQSELEIIIGKVLPDDLLGMIFSKFCIGK